MTASRRVVVVPARVRQPVWLLFGVVSTAVAFQWALTPSSTGTVARRRRAPQSRLAAAAIDESEAAAALKALGMTPEEAAASLGGSTAIAPVVVDDPQQQQMGDLVPAGALEETGPPQAPAMSYPMPAVAAAALVSEVGFEYAPLCEALRTGEFELADQITRDALIAVAGPAAKQRGYVYFTEARQLPKTDLATIENLWLHYSGGKFGYTVQKNVWRLQDADFERFCDKLGWTVTDPATGATRKRRWFGNSEFIYDVTAAPKGHLPLTSALRGTQLLKALIGHAAWDTDDWRRDLAEAEVASDDATADV